MMTKTIPLPRAGQGNGSVPERRDAAANRARILSVAQTLFDQHGVPPVTMADIAQEAGVGKGTLYRNFANKGELCLALMDTQLRNFQDEQLAAMRAQAQTGVPSMAQLARFLDALVNFSAIHLPLLCEVQHVGDVLDERETQRPHFWQYMTVQGLLRNAVQSGELPQTVDAAYTAEALLAPLAPHTFRFQRDVLGFDTARITTGLRLLLHALSSLNEVSA